MDYLDRLHKKVQKDKIAINFIQGKLSTKKMEEKVRKIGSKLKKNK